MSFLLLQKCVLTTSKPRFVSLDMHLQTEHIPEMIWIYILFETVACEPIMDVTWKIVCLKSRI